MDITTIASNAVPYLQAGLAVVGALYAVATLIGKVTPNSAVGKFCRKFAADLQPVEKTLQNVEGTVEGLAGKTPPPPPPAAPPVA